MNIVLELSRELLENREIGFLFFLSYWFLKKLLFRNEMQSFLKYDFL